MSKKNQRISAGLVLFNFDETETLQVLLVHPGGPFYRKKDAGCWSIPKGEPEPGETDLLAVAKREFAEETGLTPPEDVLYLELGSIQQKGGKIVHAWAFPGTWEKDRPVVSNLFPLEWPPKSGKIQEFPEVDRAKMCSPKKAQRKIKAAQWPLIERLMSHLGQLPPDTNHDCSH